MTIAATVQIRQTLAEHKNYLYRITAILSMRALAEVVS